MSADADADDEAWLALALPGLGPVGSLDRVAGLRAVLARLHALQMEALAAFAGASAPAGPAPVPGPAGAWAVPAAAGPDDRVVDEVAPLLGLGRVAARRRVSEADQVLRCLPETHALLGAGVIDAEVVRVVVRETAASSEEDARTVDAAVAGLLVGLTPGEARRRVARAVAQLDPAGARSRAVAGARARRVEFAPLPDGMAAMTATGPAPAVRGFYEVLTSLALDASLPFRERDPVVDLAGSGAGAGASAGARGAGGPPELDARRFDRLSQLLDQPLVGADAAAPAAGRRAGTGRVSVRSPGSGVEVLVAVSTLLGVDEQPAELSGCGPVPAVVARCWAQHARLRRFLTDPRSGLVMGVDGHTYPPGTVPDPDGPDGLDGPDGPGGRTGPGGPGGPDGRAGRDARHGPLRPSGRPLAPGASLRPTTEGVPEWPDAESTESTESTHTVETTGAPSAGLGPPAAALATADVEGASRGQSAAPARGCPVAAHGGAPYAPGAALSRLVRLHRPRCAAPGCSVPSRRCDLDHRTPWPAGATCTCQLAPLCRTHHLMKHRRGWALHAAADAPGGSALVWTSPLGEVYETHPEPPLRAVIGSRRAAALLRAAATARRPASSRRRTSSERAPEGEVVAAAGGAPALDGATWGHGATGTDDVADGDPPPRPPS